MKDTISFGELAKVLDDLPVIVLNARRLRRMSQREAAAEIGVSYSTISRIETGGECSSVSLRAVLLWLDAGHDRTRAATLATKGS